jgi:naphthoate synthase
MCKQYSAPEAQAMGLVNLVVPYEKLLSTTIEWCNTLLSHSPIALSCLKASFNADIDGQAGIQELAGLATMLYYKTDEAKEGKQAFLEKRSPDFQRFRGKHAHLDTRDSPQDLDSIDQSCDHRDAVVSKT